LLNRSECEWFFGNLESTFLRVQSRLEPRRVGTVCVPCLVQFSNQFCLLFMQRTLKRQTRTATFHFPGPLVIFPRSPFALTSLHFSLVQLSKVRCIIVCLTTFLWFGTHPKTMANKRNRNGANKVCCSMANCKLYIS